ncbi:MAG: cell division protein FtsQ/DivIB [Flavobacteriaceae bacterium]
MKQYRSLFFLVSITVLFIVCVGFSHYRNQKKNIETIAIQFTRPAKLLDELTVNKLLTQNWGSKFSLPKDSLDLNMLENQLNSTPEIENAELFLAPEGTLSLQVTERTPLFKYGSNSSLFSDANGALFHYKQNDSIPYPLFYTSSATLSLDVTAALIETLQEDPFLARELKSIELEKNQYKLSLKTYEFEVLLGTPTRVKEKIKKLKVFCAFQHVQDSLKNYKSINLSYDKQVVASSS